jgi:Domain of unknown function (DUF4386)
MTIEPFQQRAARVAGFLYVFTMATAVFAQVYVRGRLIVAGDAVKTASNIIASERLFRLGIVSDLITGVGVVVLIWGLYVSLEPINRRLALLAAFLRLMECAIYSCVLFSGFLALRLLSDASYLKPFEAPQLQALARAVVGIQAWGFAIAFVFLGFGSTVFAYLWVRSRYIPRAWAVFGIVSSLLLSLGGLLIMIFPALGAVGLTYMLPLGVYEVGLGFWLFFKGLRA